ncbi:MAG: glycosyltransferase family 39 protein [Desulfobacterales bacterium]
MSERPRWQVFGMLILAAAPLAVTLAGFFRPAILRPLFGYGAYYIMLGMVSLWAICIIRCARAEGFTFRPFLQRHYPLLILAGLLTASIFLTTPIGYKTLNDEATLLSISQSFFFERGPWEVTQADWFQGNYIPLTRLVPLRPLLFPFFVHIVHQLGGYHYINAFVLNAVVMFVFLGGVGIVCRRWTRPATAMAAIVLAATQPLVAVYGTGGGYDLMATAFFALSLALLYDFMTAPRRFKMALLWMTFILMANVRHESILYAAIMGLGMLFHIKKDWIKRHAWLLAGTPLMLGPYLWQRILVQGRYENPAGTSVFSLNALGTNAQRLLTQFLNLDFYLPYAGFLNLLGLVVFIVLVAQVLRRRIALTTDTRRFAIVALACLAANLTIILAHHAGQYDHPAQARLFMIFSVALALMPILLKIIFPQLLRGRVILTLALMLFLVHHPSAMTPRYISSLMEIRSNFESRKFLATLEADNPLVVAPWPVQFTSLGYSARTFKTANTRAGELRSALAHGYFDDLIVFQQKAAKGKRPLNGQRLAPEYDLLPVSAHPIVADKIYLQISRHRTAEPARSQLTDTVHGADHEQPQGGGN